MTRTAKIVIPLAAVLGLVALVVLTQRTDTRGFRIPSESMLPTLAIDDRITVNEDAYEEEGPQRGDIVVIHPPEGAVSTRQCGAPVRAGRLCSKPRGGPADVFFVERVVAAPGDRLRVVDGRAIVNGRPLGEPYAQECAGGESCTFRGAITIPRDHYFMLGDNRGASDDSRFWGPVPRDQIVGRVDDCWPFGLRCTEDDRTG